MTQQQWVLATGNPGKLKEFTLLLSDFAVNIRPQSDWSVTEAVEDGLSFVENAIIKARHASKATGLPAIADDSGLEVDFLRGAPGIYSARFSGESASNESNNNLLIEKLAGVPKAQRTARYQCVLVYMRHAADPVPVICHASWEGYILETPTGNGGFGYDPLFWLPEYQCSVAEMSAEQKHQLSHRGQALRLLKQKLEALGILGE